MATVKTALRYETVTVIAAVTAMITPLISESSETLADREVDIYLHNEVGKVDLGADHYRVIVGPHPELSIVDRGLLNALISTAKRCTDLEAVYDDETGNRYEWGSMDKLIEPFVGSVPSVVDLTESTNKQLKPIA